MPQKMRASGHPVVLASVFAATGGDNRGVSQLGSLKIWLIPDTSDTLHPSSQPCRPLQGPADLFDVVTSYLTNLNPKHWLVDVSVQ